MKNEREVSEEKITKNVDFSIFIENLTNLEMKIKLENIIVVDVKKLTDDGIFNKFMNSSKEFDFGPIASSGNIPKMTVSRTTLTTTPILAKWLKKYSDYFCIEDSYAFIEDLHTIKDVDEIARINANNDKPYSISLKQMTQEMKFDIDQDIIKQLNEINYENYISIDISSSGLQISKVDDYSETGNCYSFPFIRSLLYNYKIKNTDLDNCILNFFEFTTNQNIKTIGFSVNFNTSIASIYFDFSNRPPGGALNILYLEGNMPTIKNNDDK